MATIHLTPGDTLTVVVGERNGRPVLRLLSGADEVALAGVRADQLKSLAADLHRLAEHWGKHQ